MASFQEGPRHRSRGRATAMARDGFGSLKPHLRQLGKTVGIAFDRLDSGYRPHLPAVSDRSETGGVELEGVSVAYGDRVGVAGITGRFAPGSLTAVVGPNGAGKSSLLKAIAGILPLRSGTIRSAARAGRVLAYLPQQAEIDRGFPVSVGELVALGAWREFGAFRRPPESVFDRVAEAATSAGLEGLLDRAIENLSAGEFQRALFARLLLQDAPLILLDEPFAAVDERTMEDLLRVVLRWHESGRTVIAVLHDLDQVRAHFPMTLLLARSCIGWDDTSSVLTNENLTRARKTLQERTNAPVRA